MDRGAWQAAVHVVTRSDMTGGLKRERASHSYSFSSSYVWMWELDYKECWVLKNWCFWTVVLEKTLESPLDCKEIKSVIPKRNQSWIFIGRTAAETEAPILWPPCMKKKTMHWWRPWCWERLKAGGEGGDRGWDFGWCHWLNGHEFQQAPGVGDGQGRLTCCSPWGCRELDMTEWLNWTDSFINMR